MENITNSIKACFNTSANAEEMKQLSSNLKEWLDKAAEEQQYGDVNIAIKITLTILEEIGNHSEEASYKEYAAQLKEIAQTAINIIKEILDTPSTRSDIKLMLEYDFKHLKKYSIIKDLIL